MRLSESRIRLIIRDELQENLRGFLDRTRGIEYSASEEDDPTFEVDPESRDLARAVKRAWAAEADHRFMDSVTKIHWMNAATDDNIQKLLSSSGRDEISTMGYINGPYNSGLGGWPVWGKIGFVIKGRTTLASNSMDDLYSGYHKNIPPEVREKYKSSGIRKRATGFNPWKADSYILDSASFDPAMQGENEFIVSHWKVTGAVLTESESEKLSAALKGGEIPDWQADEWDRIFGLLDRLGVPWLMRKHRNRVRAWLDRRTSSGVEMKITESQLRRIIREELEESEVAIATLGNTSTGPVYVVAYRPDELEAVLNGEDGIQYSGVVAGVGFRKGGGAHAGRVGECNGAWHVASAASRERGRGTQVYLAALDFLRNISSDRFSVTAEAEGMWKKLARYDFVEREEFDDIKNPKTPPKSDDCRVFPARDPALNSSWRVKGEIPSSVKDLVDLGDRHLRELDTFGSQRQEAERILGLGFGELFQHLY